MTDRTSVLVTGAGLSGLAAGIFLAWQKIPVVVIDKHSGSSPHPRAIGITQRTMQFIRALGLSEEVPEVPDGYRLRRARVHSLAGDWYEEQPWTPGAGWSDVSHLSPVRGAAIAQDSLEPILRRKAVELGADVRLSTTLLGFLQDTNGVTAIVRERDSGRGYRVRADYLIGADGNRSMIREQLGIERHGIGHLRSMHSILFRADLDQYLERGVTQFTIDQGDFNVFLTTYRDGRWVVYYSGRPVTDRTAQERMVRRAVGRSDLAIEIISSGSWDLTGLINDSYAQGRVFLIGDAAHTLPPTRAGWGANTGIDDANNLAWKLAAVIRGESKPALLDTYNAERQPIGTLRHDQTFARPDYKAAAGDQAKDVELFSDVAMELGQLYRSSAVIGAGPELPSAAEPEVWAGQPGTLARHLWIDRNGENISTLDLYFNQWTLVTEDPAWVAAAQAAHTALEIRIIVVRFGVDVCEKRAGSFREAYGLDAGGATLVRPDGYIAWRAVDLPENPSSALIDALRSVASAIEITREQT